MKTKIHRSWNQATVIEEIDIIKIHQALSEEYDSVEFKADCSEGSTLTFESLDELIDYENPNFRRIEKVHIFFAKQDNSGGLFLHDSAPIGLLIEDVDDGRALKIATAIEQRIRNCKPWYSFLARSPLGVYIGTLGIVYYTIFNWLHFLRTGRLIDVPFSLSVVYIILPFLAIYLLFLHFGDKLWKKAFPRFWLGIGRQKDEYKKGTLMRRWIISAFATILLGITANFITQAIVG